MASASDSINRVISKGRDVVGAVGAVADIPGVPEELRSAIGSLFGTGRGLPAGRNRRDLNNFLGTVSKLKGFARPAYFYVEIYPPLTMRDNINESRNLAFLCESANLPGVSFDTSYIRRYGFGPTERKPYAPVFIDTTMTFFCDGSGMVQKFFYKWMNSIIKYDEMPYGYGTEVNSFRMAPFRVNYKEQYASDIVVTTVDESNNDIITVRFRDAFPIFMGDVNLGWGDTDSISRLPITFTYFNWKIENINLKQVQESRESGLIQKLIKTGTAIQTLATIKKPNNVADIVNIVNNTKIALGGLR